MTTLNNLGKRICIIGRSCAGKSTLADKLSRKLGVSLLHLDQIAFIPHTNWQRCPDEEFIAKHTDFLAQNDEWIIEGNYSVTMIERLQRADSVIFADFSRYGYLWQYIKRCISTKISPENRIGAMQGAKSEFNWGMVSFVWQQYPQNTQKYEAFLAEYMAEKPIFRIKNFRQLNQFYRAIEL
jgi:adenylate kinase family enzyme